MEDDLPSDFDTIVIGTGMPECILAAAHARNGKQVLHIDRNDFYGGIWATFNLDGLERWMEQINKVTNETDIPENKTHYSQFLKDGESLLSCSYNTKVFSNLTSEIFIKETVENSDGKSELCPDCRQSPNGGDSADLDPNNTSQEGVQSSVSEENPQSESKGPDKEEWTMKKIRSLYRKFNLDLAPKLLFSRGELVDLLISSNIARYAEFKSVTRVLTVLKGKLEQVPCSRSDVFSTKNVSIVEKRMLMKLLTFCTNFEESPKEYQGFENRTFLEFLKSRKLTENVQHYVLHAIAMVAENATTLEGLKATQRFLNSLGRYGNTPFLWPLYGSGELPQCFCRLCAVFGGIYYLKRELEAVILDADNRCSGIISNGRRLNCRHLVMDANFAPKTFLPDGYGERQLSRAILLTNKSILPADKEQLTFCRLPSENGLPTAVWLVELGPAAMASPSDLYVVHLTCETQIDSKSDLQAAVQMLFDVSENENSQAETDKPKLLWSTYFNQIDNSLLELQSRCPENVYLTSGPGNVPDYDGAVTEARELFKRTFPDEEFLPRAPDPEEIVIEDAEEATPETGIVDSAEPQEEKTDPDAANTTCAEENSGECAAATEEGDSTPTAECEEFSEALQKEE